MLADGFGRVATDLRVSLTDRCNLRCTYCMPAEGLDWTPSEQILSAAELVRLIALAVAEGVTQVRFTGGEPMLRRDLEEIVAAVAALPVAPSISLTTNGIGLLRRAGRLRSAGLRRINVSLDTLDRERFATLTRRDRLEQVVEGLFAAREAGLDPVKINTVLMRGVNDDETVALARWSIKHGFRLRFIEQMPLDPQHGWSRNDMVTAAEILDALQAELVLEPSESARGSEPAETWRVVDPISGHEGTVGVIGSVTRPFCQACDRVRLTADGQLRNCLFAATESDLRGPMRAGADDSELVAIMRRCLEQKKAGHGIDEPTFLQPPRPMSAIGG
ncbi:MAG TPA: GTP 3',8-cyclase MoaA [Actinomycetes bacterium]|nr:GTP 3',8-cyclase MoaA [Actinomycetes bacterium]